ncbi:MAG: QueT transporter family protein [Clostridiaceae bacterium]|nr:QueT transporter family protein [Clostridiaceae bacterium]
MKITKSTKYLVQAAAIGAVYAVLTIALAPISYGIMQVRVSEAMTILPYFTPAAIPGLFIGCLIANIYGGLGIIDIVFGSLATLVAAFLSYKLRKWKFLVPIPPIIINAIVVGIVLYYAFLYEPQFKSPLIVIMGWVALGQLISCYGLGYPLMVMLEKYRHKF